jgi:hypothetical protein
MIVSKFQRQTDGSILIIRETKAGNYIGEVYPYNDNKNWWMKATSKAKDGDASEYRVKEYFGFTNENSKQLK